MRFHQTQVHSIFSFVSSASLLTASINKGRQGKCEGGCVVGVIKGSASVSLGSAFPSLLVRVATRRETRTFSRTHSQTCVENASVERELEILSRSALAIASNYQVVSRGTFDFGNANFVKQGFYKINIRWLYQIFAKYIAYFEEDIFIIV